MTSDPLARLGRLLTASEAAALAARFEDGDTMSQALQVISLSRRPEVRGALEDAGVTTWQLAVSLPVLRAIHGAASRPTEVRPVWTTPGNLAGYGNLTTSIKDLVLSARHCVTCSTFNFQKSSALWDALTEVSARGTVDVRVYVDTHAAGANGWPSAPTVDEIAAQFPGAHVFRSGMMSGKPVRNHAKFVAVDHQFMVVTSANFSFSAEQMNVELGLRIDDASLVQQVERQLLEIENLVYVAVTSD